MEKNMNNPEEKRPKFLSKTKRAGDWALSCLIRLPMIIIVLSVILGTVFLVMLIIAPENAKLAIEYLKLWLGKN